MYSKPIVVHSSTRNVYVMEALDEKGEVSQQLNEFADFIQAPEQVHTFNLSPYALWTAKAKHIQADHIIDFLEKHSQNSIPESLKMDIKKNMDHFGALEFSIKEDHLMLTARTKELIETIKEIQSIKTKIIDNPDPTNLVFKARYRTEIKKILFKNNLFVKDIIYKFGDPLELKCTFGPFYDYQLQAVNEYLTFNHQAGGGGTIIMPPNSGKMFIGLKLIEELKTSTLIITKDKYKVEKWYKEIIESTDLSEQNITIFERSGTDLKPITIGTYETLSRHIDELEGFGFIIYDEAHNLPTPTHELTADIRATNKLALAATLARSDENGILVYALVGPRWYEISYPSLVNRNYQVPVNCIEVKVPLPQDEWFDYLARNPKNKVNADSTNSRKYKTASIILKKEVTNRVLLVSYFNEVTQTCSEHFQIAKLSSHLNEDQRQVFIRKFNNKEIDKLLASWSLIENMNLQSIDVMIALSYQQGSEREEYLRLGKLIQAEEGKRRATLYSLVSQNTDEEKYYVERRKSLINLGFRYRILTFDELMERGEFFES
ncbi:helicase-associated domain-containing protein [Peribacillus sp. N1]